jgi:thioredoxin reductase (NADPH)
MPGMTGVEFLEQAMDIAPRAKRVLLTAYADTDAAIRAINDIDLDRYLLKPWDPPEERLYPPLDELLAEWSRAAAPSFSGVTLVGHQWSAETQQAKEFLARNQVPYRHLDLRAEPAHRLLRAANLDEDTSALPVAFMPDGTVIRCATPPELARAVGLATTAGSPFYDVVVVGGGPAGLGSAVYAASEGLRTLLVEQEATGGQAGQSSRIENYLGFPDGISGGQLAERARRQAAKFGVEVVTARDVVGLQPHGPKRVVRFGDGGGVAGHAVVLATGVSYRSLGARGCDELTGRGVYYGSAMTEADECADRDVYIVGGANSAGQAAVYFARRARSVQLLVRAPSLESSMSSYLVEQLAEIPNVVVRTCTVVAEAHGDGHLEGLTLQDARSGERETVSTNHLFVFIGAAPRTDWLDGVVVRDERGFVCTGPELLADGARPADWPLDRDPFFLESSVPGVFVAGDVRAESVKRVASAVGEGAMAVMLVHKYLGER